MGEKVAVSGGYFDDIDGFISIYEIIDADLRPVKNFHLKHPMPDSSQTGKGITGLVYNEDKNLFWACFSNCIVQYNPHAQEITDTIFDSRFNDLHDLFTNNGQLVVVNTGNESIDTINLQTKEVTRIDFLGDDLRKLTPSVTNTSSTKPHLHHISSAKYNKSGDLIVGFFKQQRILNLSNWTQVGKRMDSPVHDIQIVDDEVFWTTISGGVYSSLNIKPLLDLKEHCASIGWTRGLHISKDYFLVGSTSIRETNSNFFNILTGENLDYNPAKLVLFDRKRNQVSRELIVKRADVAKIYSIIPVRNY